MLLPEAVSLDEALAVLTSAFMQAGLETPASDAKALLCAAARMRPLELALRPDQPLGEAARETLAGWAAQRLAREPVTRIIGERGFWTFEVRVAPEVLDPRPDTEVLVDSVLRVLSAQTHAPLRILDLGTGSGVLLAALLMEFPNASGVGLDLSEAAVQLATFNIKALGLEGRASLRKQDWATGVKGRFDLIVSNPPYIATHELETLAPEVQHYDPKLALDGGPDGLDAYRSLSRLVPGLLTPGGTAAFEMGAGQARDVSAIMGAAGLILRHIARDYADHERAAVFHKP